MSNRSANSDFGAFKIKKSGAFVLIFAGLRCIILSDFMPYLLLIKSARRASPIEPDTSPENDLWVNLETASYGFDDEGNIDEPDKLGLA